MDQFEEKLHQDLHQFLLSMKKVMFLLAVGVMCLTACAQKKKDGERGPRQGGHMAISTSSDGKQEAYSPNRARAWSTWHPSTMDIRLPQFATGCSSRVNRL